MNQTTTTKLENKEQNLERNAIHNIFKKEIESDISSIYNGISMNNSISLNYITQKESDNHSYEVLESSTIENYNKHSFQYYHEFPTRDIKKSLRIRELIPKTKPNILNTLNNLRKNPNKSTSTKTYPTKEATNVIYAPLPIIERKNKGTIEETPKARPRFGRIPMSDFPEGTKVIIRKRDHHSKNMAEKLKKYIDTEATVHAAPIYPGTWFAIKMYDGIIIKCRSSTFYRPDKEDHLITNSYEDYINDLNAESDSNEDETKRNKGNYSLRERPKKNKNYNINLTLKYENEPLSESEMSKGKVYSEVKRKKRMMNARRRKKRKYIKFINKQYISNSPPPPPPPLPQIMADNEDTNISNDDSKDIFNYGDFVLYNSKNDYVPPPPAI